MQNLTPINSISPDIKSINAALRSMQAYQPDWQMPPLGEEISANECRRPPLLEIFDEQGRQILSIEHDT